jgi:hypothetical protein
MSKAQEDDEDPMNAGTEADIGESLLGELRSHSQSDREAFSALHTELRRIAHAKMRSERRDHTLQPTALVNEAFIKIFKGNLTPEFWIDRSRAIRYIVHSISQILNDHADAYRSLKRGGDRVRAPLDQEQHLDTEPSGRRPRIDPALLVTPESSERVLAVREAVAILRKTAPRQADIIELIAIFSSLQVFEKHMFVCVTVASGLWEGLPEASMTVDMGILAQSVTRGESDWPLPHRFQAAVRRPRWWLRARTIKQGTLYTEGQWSRAWIATRAGSGY